jgi:hypothetical protein
MGKNKDIKSRAVSSLNEPPVVISFSSHSLDNQLGPVYCLTGCCQLFFLNMTCDEIQSDKDKNLIKYMKTIKLKFNTKQI